MSKLESKVQQTEKESQRPWLQSSGQKWKSQTKVEEPAQGHHLKSGVEVREVFSKILYINQLHLQKITAPGFPDFKREESKGKRGSAWL